MKKIIYTDNLELMQKYMVDVDFSTQNPNKFKDWLKKCTVSDHYLDLCVDRFILNKSVRDIAEDRMMSKSKVHRDLQTALNQVKEFYETGNRKA